MFHVLLTRTSPPLSLFTRILPESLRWLLATQQYCRSKWIMGHIAKKNRVNLELDTDNILTGSEGIERNQHAISCIVHLENMVLLWFFVSLSAQ